MDKQSRFKSKVFWVAVIAQLISIGQLSGLFVKFGVDAGYIGDIAAAILQLGVIVGLLNDPTNPNGF